MDWGEAVGQKVQVALGREERGMQRAAETMVSTVREAVTFSGAQRPRTSVPPLYYVSNLDLVKTKKCAPSMLSTTMIVAAALGSMRQSIQRRTAMEA